MKRLLVTFALALALTAPATVNANPPTCGPVLCIVLPPPPVYALTPAPLPPLRR